MRTPQEKPCRSSPSERRAWRSLGQLSELWGLSRTRTGLVLEGLVQSGRMEVRRAPREQDEGCEYRVLRKH